MKRAICAVAVAILCFFYIGSYADAGGWAVVTLDFLPARLVVNQPLTIGFNVRQHGRTPAPGLDVSITAMRVESKDIVTAAAKDEGPAGHYVATLTFPSAGQWQWYIDAFGSQQPMPTLTVMTLSSAADATGGASIPSSMTMQSLSALYIVFGALVLAVGLAWLIIRRNRTHRRFVYLIFAVLLAISGFALWQLSSQPASSAGSLARPQESAVQMGHDLFIAKGCIVCHQNDRARYSQTKFFAVRIGPDLTKVKLQSQYLHTWLRDPSKVKPGTEMPTLGLSESEIDALVAFLRDEGAGR